MGVWTSIVGTINVSTYMADILDKEVNLLELEKILNNNINGSEDTTINYNIIELKDNISINFCCSLRDYNNIDELKAYFEQIILNIKQVDIFSIIDYVIKIKCNYPEVVIYL